MRRFIIPALLLMALLLVSCSTLPTGREKDGQVEVQLFVFRVPVLFAKWYTKKVSEWVKTVEQVKDPLLYAQWGLLGACVASAIACMYVQAPLLQKRLLRISAATGVAYLVTVAVFLTASAILGHPWWLALVVCCLLGVGCWWCWKKYEEETL